MEAIEHSQSMMTESERRMREEEISFYSASENDHGDDNIWGLLSGVGGNVYEWYVDYDCCSCCSSACERLRFVSVWVGVRGMVFFFFF